ncbi:MAG TPA: HAD-IB family hydrolase [Polyangiaceae bacterium]|nr:HAD-IB family hydrolase [Polyangiaceae bacterium]
MPRRAALFDMDRTLIHESSAALYTRYRRDLGEATYRDTLQVGWWLLQYTLGWIDAERVAQRALGIYRGTLESEMIERCRIWFPQYVLALVADEGRRAVREHGEAGELLAIVTGSTHYAARPLADELGIPHVVASEIATDEAGRFTGDVVPPLCLGLGKLARTRALLERHGIELADATFYTDSITDLPLLEAVGRPIVVNPDPRLAREARRRGWPVQRWKP